MHCLHQFVFAFPVLLSCLACLVSSNHAHAESNTITITMPAEGWASIAINDANGKRVRNLFGNLPLKAGEHSFEWDGRDDKGNKVEPGEYRWIGLHRGDIAAIYRGTFQHGNPPWLYGQTGGWASDHSSVTAVARVGNRMLLGSNEAEWGRGLIATDLDGNKQWGVKWLTGRGWCGAEAIAAIGNRAFATSYVGECAVWEIDVETGRNQLVLTRDDVPGVEDKKKRWAHLRIVGAHETPDGGEVYLADVFGQYNGKPGTLVYKVNGKNEKLTYDRTLPMRLWGMTWLPDGRCIAAADYSVVELNTMTGTTKAFTSSPISAPWDVTSDAQGNVYVSDQGANGQHKYTRHGQLKWRYLRLDRPSSQQVKVFDSSGKLLRAMGRKGGQQIGKLNPNDFFQPAGLDIDARGRLWVSEMTSSPKRVSVWSPPQNWSTSAPRLAEQFLGPAHYGGGAWMVDPTRPWELTDSQYGTVFDVDIDRQTFRADRLPWRWLDIWKEHGYRPNVPFTGRPGIAIKAYGRSFAACAGGYMHGSDANLEPYKSRAEGPVMIGEYVGERFIPRAAIGNIRMWMRGRELNTRRDEQWVPKAILDAARLRPDWPKHAQAMGMGVDDEDVPHVEHKRGAPVWIVHPWPKDISGMIWVDQDGDASVDPNEVTFHRAGDFGGVTIDDKLNAYFSVPSWHKDDTVGTFKLPCQGVNEAGAPVYSWESLTRISNKFISLKHVGSDGSILSTTSLHDASGNLVWSYPSDKRGVRQLGGDAHKTVKPGTVFRVRSLRGVVKGPGNLGDVYMMHSVDGQSYLMTRDDGLFITMLFRPYSMADGWDAIADATPGVRLDKHSQQDECFNGHFQQAQANGKGFRKGSYYLLGAGRSAVVEITGLDRVQRFAGGSVMLDANVGKYAKGERYDPAGGAVPATSTKTIKPVTAVMRESGVDIYSGPPAKWGSTWARFGWDNRHLYIKAFVQGDTSKFINNGTDYREAFATGDAFELQVNSPKLGPLRFVAAMHNNEPVVVRMQYKGKPTRNAYTYVSGVAETKVADVRIIQHGYNVRRVKNGWVVQFSLNWEYMGITPKPGMRIPADIGICFSDPTGNKTQSRMFWAGGGINMVADMPTEAKPAERYGTIILGKTKKTQSHKSTTSQETKNYKTLKPYMVPMGSNYAAPARVGHAEAFSAYDNRGIHLKFHVKKDSSVFQNNAQTLEAIPTSGDACEFIVTTKRFGVCRFLLADFKGSGVLIRQHMANGTIVTTKTKGEISVRRFTEGYAVQTTIPWSALGGKLTGGAKIKADFGVLRSDDAGKTTVRIDRAFGPSVTDEVIKSGIPKPGGLLELSKGKKVAQRTAHPKTTV